MFSTSRTPMPSMGIQFFTSAPFSHIGVIVVDPPQRVLDAYYIAEKDPRNCYVLEACMKFAHDDPQREKLRAKAGDKRTTAVQLNSLARWLKDFQEKGGEGIIGEKWLVAMRSLRHQPSTSAMQVTSNYDKFFEWMLSVSMKEYETNIMELVGSATGWHVNDEKRLDSFFCSELVAESLIWLGVAHKDTESNTYAPADFWGSARPHLLRHDHYYDSPQRLLYTYP